MNKNIINFALVVLNLLPPLLRNNAMIAWLRALTKPLQKDNNDFNEYLSGTTYPNYSATTSYNIGDRVVYGFDSVYENLSGSTNILPTNTAYWYMVNPNFIGAVERSLYNGQKIKLEWELNRIYRTPSLNLNPTQFSGANHTNQIWIQNNALLPSGFLMGQTGPYSSNMAKNSIYSTSYMGNHYSGVTSNCFTINVPQYIYSATTEPIIRSWVDPIVISGIEYNVVNY